MYGTHPSNFLNLANTDAWFIRITKVSQRRVRGGELGRRLFDHWNQLRFDDALVRRHQPQPVNACGSHDCTIGGISQAATQRSDLRSDFGGEWKDPEHRAGLQFLEEIAHGRL